MKKFFKIFIIVLLIVGVIALTCFFFFKKYKEKNNTTGSIAVMLANNSGLNKEISDVNNILQSESDSRLEVVIAASKGLDAVTYELATYYINNDTKIQNEQIANKLNQIDSTKILLSKMINEYKLKVQSNYFDKKAGANDLYHQSCVYLIQYSELVSLINSDVPVSTTVDVKFSLFELYTIVVAQTFSSETIDSKNIEALSAMFADGRVDLANQFSVNANEFIRYFNIINKNEFASNLSMNIENSSPIADNIYRLTAYYLSEII